MKEIAVVPWNGYTAASTFSGCGGSSLGYKMAGFRVAYANEFVEAARDTYRANFPDTHLDDRDIREVKPEDVLDACGVGPGELDLLDGSPPCAAFSTAGKREVGWGEVRKYSNTKQRVDDLFFEYARLVDGIRPKVFVAENVYGLVKGTAKGYFKEILTRLRACGYVVEARVLDAKWLGVPQTRSRLIFVGVREDLGVQPVHPRPIRYLYTLRDALPGLESLRFKTGHNDGLTVRGDEVCPPVTTGGMGGPSGWPAAAEDVSITVLASHERGRDKTKLVGVRAHSDRPSPAVTQRAENGAAGVTHPTERRRFTIEELKRICAFPDDFVVTGTFQQQWERLGRAVPPVMMSHIAATVRDEVLAHVRPLRRRR